MEGSRPCYSVSFFCSWRPTVRESGVSIKRGRIEVFSLAQPQENEAAKLQSKIRSTKSEARNNVESQNSSVSNPLIRAFVFRLIFRTCLISLFGFWILFRANMPRRRSSSWRVRAPTLSWQITCFPGSICDAVFDVHIQPAEPRFKLNVMMMLRLNMFHLLQAVSPNSSGLQTEQHAATPLLIILCERA